ncbi:MAG: hypothetical protein K2Y22_06480 [Candidatus Obscuribacterales bacterium]|nr:hypothetical protein [Candidatus Obscuribacterales bacterium]
MATKFTIETKRREEREILNYRHVCPDQIGRHLLRVDNIDLISEKRQAALKALDVVDRLGDSEITEDNLASLRQVLVVMSQKCQFEGTDVGDILQQVQTKLEPGYDMATDMFEALYTETCKLQLAQDRGYGLAITCALLALRAAIKRDLKKQLAGSNDRAGIERSLVLLADAYERINSDKRAAELRALAAGLGQ